MKDIHIMKNQIDFPFLMGFEGAVIFSFVIIIIIISLLITIIHKIIIKNYKEKYININISKKESENKKNIYKETITSLKNIEQLIKDGKFEEFYIKLTKIIKEYFIITYKINIKEPTSKEILDVITIEEKYHIWLKDLLKQIDSSKFSQKKIDITECKKDYQNTKELIKNINNKNDIQL